MDEIWLCPLNLIASFYNAADETALLVRSTDIRSRLMQLEAALGDGRYFAGDSFCMVDAVLVPIFRYFDAFDAIGDFGFWTDFSRAAQWRVALAKRPSVVQAVRSDSLVLLSEFLAARRSALSLRMIAWQDDRV